jgi:vacuolar protein sorting-associated protein 72
MKAMLANEEPDSDLELLFAEDDDDQGFTDVVDDASDVHMDSSSDDEDENAAEDDMEGEKELERQAREKRNAQRKRKAQEAIPAKFRKKVRIDTTTTPSPAPSSASGPGPRPKKKSERSSWLPSAADMPTRASSRQTTRLSKEQLHAQMEEREARRLKQLAQMQKKAARMEALKKPPMTQEERLREAEIVEKRNSKSLNRWEIAEKQREEERRAKLAALNERTLKGPVITFWSGTREWQDGGAARYVVMEEKPKKKPREKKDKTKGKGNDKDKKGVPEEDPQNADKEVEKKEASEDSNKNNVEPKDSAPAKPTMEEESKQTSAPRPPESATPAPEQPETDNKSSTAGETAAPQETGDTSTLQAPPATTSTGNEASPVDGLAPPAHQPSSSLSPQPSESNPDNKLSAPILAPPVGMDVDQSPSSNLRANHSKSHILAPPNTSQSPQPLPDPAPATTSPGDELSNSNPVDARPAEDKPAVEKPSEEKLVEDTPAKKESSEKKTDLSAPESTPENPPDTTTPSEQPQEKKEGSTYTRNAIVYQNFDDTALKDKSIQVQILFGRKMNKLASMLISPRDFTSIITWTLILYSKQYRLHISPEPPPHPVCVITNHPARYRDPKTGLPFYNAHAYGEIRRLERGDYRWSKLLGSWVGSGKNAASGVPERFLNPNAPGPKKEAKKEEGQAKEQEKAGEKGNAGQEAVPANKAEQTAPEPPLEDIKPQPEHQQTPPNNPNPPIETKT